jgi:hypothetical protein
MTDPIRRGVRTFLDVAFVTAVVQALVEFGVALTAGQRAVLVTLGTFAVSAAKNALEDAGAIPAFAKAPASDGENPVPDAGQTAAGGLVTALVVVILLVVLLRLLGAL